jgi:hypothetical protein
MIRFLLLTRDPWAWQRQCNAGVWPGRGILGRAILPNPSCDQFSTEFTLPGRALRATLAILDPQEHPADRSFRPQADYSKPIGRPLQ